MAQSHRFLSLPKYVYAFFIFNSTLCSFIAVTLAMFEEFITKPLKIKVMFCCHVRLHPSQAAPWTVIK